MAGVEIMAWVQVPFWHHDGSMMGWHWGWGLFWFALAILAIWGVARAVSSGNESPTPRNVGAEEALRRRFAEGEITREELEQGLKVLRDSM